MNDGNITKVYLLSVPLENDFKNTLYFTDKSSQQSYFASKVKKSYTDFTYQRKDNVIYVPDHYDHIYNCNYVMYQNTKYNNKWFYAFIKDMKYENNECTMIEIETDVIQTWLFDYTIKPSFVEREHVSDDDIGLHTVPEGLETGEYYCNEQVRDTRLDSLGIFMAIHDYPEKKFEVKGNVYGGVYSGMAYEFYPYTGDGITSLNERLNAYDDDAKAEGINSIFMGPKNLIFDPAGDEPGACTLTRSWTPYTYHLSTSKQTKLNGYTPRNKKLLTYPYNYLYASNNNGSSVIYQYEKFHTDTCEFEVQGAITPGFSIRMCPQYYNGLGINHDEGLNMGKYAICCWNSDTYTNWLTQNSVNVGVGVAGGVVSAGLGVAALFTGVGALAGVGMIAGGLTSIGSSLGQVHSASKMPDQVKGNTNCGDVITGGKNNCYMFHKMSIKKEYAEIIDKYFDVYGYKVNMIKTPNKAHRGRWWYTKTIDINIDGSIPGNDMQKIKDCYNNGITFWRNANEINNYNLSNDIV